jgi:hypothetical protein
MDSSVKRRLSRQQQNYMQLNVRFGSILVLQTAYCGVTTMKITLRGVSNIKVDCEGGY